MKTWDVFLGGPDLEMIEIAKLLATRDDVVVHDRHLAWGARASEYLSEIEAALEQSRGVILVELIDDLPNGIARDRLTIVNHHGPAAGENSPTSIEQLFALLGFSAELWTRDLTLVAANDRGYIEGMLRAGATTDQIRDIRARDRRAQGITEEEERLGLEAARRATQRFDGRLTLVNLSHCRSATVTDALDATLGGPGFRNLLVRCPSQTLFFGDGRGIETLRNHFPGGWFGGELPRRGYWGIARTVPENALMEALKAPLTTRPATEIAVKAFHHTLIWPLLMRGPSESQPGSGQSILGHVQALTEAGWQESASPNEATPIEGFTYEEIVYFHPFVRDFLFGDGKTKVQERALRRFRRTDVIGVRIAIEAGDPAIDFRVERCEILLLRPQVLILLVEMSNRKCDRKTAEDPRIGDERLPLTLEQVLFIQSRIRHIYPPYFIGSTHGDVLASVEWIGLKTGYEMTDKVPDPAARTPHTDGDPASGKRLTMTSPKDAFFRFVAKGSEPPIYAHWRVFFGDKIKPFETAHSRDDGGLYLQQLIDDRIPSMSFVAVDNPTEIHQDDLDRLPAFDAPGLEYEPEFRARHRESFQYTRFRHWGTTYFCNGTSFAMLCGIGDFTDLLLTHFRRHYTHLGVIAHFQHAALLYFADEMAETAKELAAQSGDDDLSNPAWAMRIRRLQRRFLKFRTRSYFTEVSNQVQGKDLFKLWFDQLGTKALFDRVSDTNAEVYEALENHEMKELAKVQTYLSRIATVFLPISVIVTAISAFPVFFKTPFASTSNGDHPNAIVILMGLTLCGILVCFFSWKEPKNPPPEANT